MEGESTVTFIVEKLLYMLPGGYVRLSFLQEVPYAFFLASVSLIVTLSVT